MTSNTNTQVTATHFNLAVTQLPLDLRMDKKIRRLVIQKQILDCRVFF